MDYGATTPATTLEGNTQYLIDEKKIYNQGPDKQIMDQPTTEQKAEQFRRTAGYYEEPLPVGSGLDVIDVILINQAMSNTHNDPDCCTRCLDCNCDCSCLSHCLADCGTCSMDALSGIGHGCCQILEGLGSIDCGGCDISI